MTRYTFDPHANFQHVILVGAGGTGSQWARSLARIVFDLRRRGHHIPQIAIIDPDVVSEANLGRQLYSVPDLGQNKAFVLATRFNCTLGLNIHYIDEPFNARKHIPRDHYGHNTLLCGAVDNHLARAELADAPAVYIDAGNSYSSGQLSLGTTRSADRVKHGLNAQTKRCSELPNVALVYPQIVQPELQPAPAANLSCAELIAQGEQHLLINDLIADIAAHYTYRLLNQQPVDSFLTHVDAETLTVQSTPITDETIAHHTRQR